MDEKILILMAVNDNNILSLEHMNGTKREVRRASIYRKVSNPILRVVRKIWRNLGFPGYQIWFDSWWNEIGQYDSVIAVAYKSTWRLFKILKRKYPNIRRIMYWWDPIQKTISPNEVEDDTCEKWTFCKKDASRFGILYNPTFMPVSGKIGKEEEYDIVFVGSGHGKLYENREKILESLLEKCEKWRLKTSFHLWKGQNKEKCFSMKKVMNEQEYYDLVSKSKAILDIIEPSAAWMTLRPLEALYFKKKLITNNIDIIDEPLYDAENVFILGKNDIEYLPQFMSTPLKELNKDVYDYYTFEAWLDRFSSWKNRKWSHLL